MVAVLRDVAVDAEGLFRKPMGLRDDGFNDRAIRTSDGVALAGLPVPRSRLRHRVTARSSITWD